MRVVIADDSDHVRTSLARLLSTIPEVEVIADACDGDNAVRLVRELNPDLLILDMHMRGKGGLYVLKELAAGHDSVRVLVFTGYSDPHTRQLALDHGAAAFVSKGNVQAFLDTLTQLMQS